MVKALTFFVWWLSTVLVVLLWDCRTGCNLTALNLLMRLSSALISVLTVALIVWAIQRLRSRRAEDARREAFLAAWAEAASSNKSTVRFFEALAEPAHAGTHESGLGMPPGQRHPVSLELGRSAAADAVPSPVRDLGAPSTELK